MQHTKEKTQNMTRKKLNLAYIANDSMRKATFNKRKQGFMKKIHELSVLCGIEACAVIHSPFNSFPEVWPSNIGVKNVVDKFEKMTKSDQEKRMVNHGSFLRQNILKTMENNNKRMKDNAERTLKEAMFQLLEGKGDKLKLTNKNREDLCKYIDQYLKQLYHHRGQILNHSNLEYGESSEAKVEVSSYSCPNLDIISSSERPDGNFLFTAADQQGYCPDGVFDQNPKLNQYEYQEQFGYPVVAQDEIYDVGQNQNQHERNGLVNQMMNQYPE